MTQPTDVNIDLNAAVDFMATHGRLIDRRRLSFLLGEADADGVLSALDAYRNADGGYGWALEPDLRSAESQPVGAMHALWVLADLAPVMTTPHAVELCGWLEQHTLTDGGLPFVLPLADPAGCAPWWLAGDASSSSLQMTTQVAAKAHLVARHDPAVAGHPWLRTATDWCLAAIETLDTTPHAFELLFATHFLDAAADSVPQARALFDHLARYVPPDGSLPVVGGAEDEAVHPLDLSPDPAHPSRDLFSADVIAADVERLAALQQPDGGWIVNFKSSSPAATLEWRGYATAQAIAVLRRS